SDSFGLIDAHYSPAKLVGCARPNVQPLRPLAVPGARAVSPLVSLSESRSDVSNCPLRQRLWRLRIFRAAQWGIIDAGQCRSEPGPIRSAVRVSDQLRLIQTFTAKTSEVLSSHSRAACMICL